MDERLFRYLYEKTSDAIIMTGCTWNKETQEQTRYVYTCQVNYGMLGKGGCHKNTKQESYNMEPIDVFIMGAFSVKDIERLLHAVYHEGVHTVILPYVTPVQRFSIARMMHKNHIEKPELIQFVQDPYQYMQKLPIKRFYYVYGNGKEIINPDREMYTGHYFEPQEQEVLKIIEEMEGYAVPVVKAGYLVENYMLFYLGYYGTDVRQILLFQRNYQTMSQIKHIIFSCLEEFEEPGLTLFCSPIEVSLNEKDCVFYALIPDHANQCHANLREDDGKCSVKCLLYEDYDAFRFHRKKVKGGLRLGMLLLGNIRLNKHIHMLKQRYQAVEKRIRAVTIPNGGNIKNWDSKFVQKKEQCNTLYWLCPMQPYTSAQILREIKMGNSKNRIINLSKEYGCCFNGYVADKHT